MKPEPAGGAYAFLSVFERPLIPSAWTVLFTYSERKVKLHGGLGWNLEVYKCSIKNT
jgi:hypothetical protein